jgi:hypothetical protein
MGGSYLEIAEYVLEARAKPLSAQEILADAQKYGLLPERLSGATMQKTLQARIAEDIFRHRAKSNFYRTSIGTYYLRRLSADDSLPPRLLNEHPTVARRRPWPDNILHVQIPALGNLNSSGWQKLAELSNQYFPLGDAPADYVPTCTVSILQWRGTFLSHVAGRYSPIYNNEGKRIVGLKRYVDEFDIDLIEEDQAGLRLSSIRECGRIISHVERFISAHVPLGLLNVHDGIAAAFLVVIDESWTGPLVRRLDINKPTWLKRSEAERIDDPLTAHLIAKTFIP